MNEIDMSSILSQLRATAAAAGGKTSNTDTSQAPDFVSMMKSAVGSVSDSQQRAAQLARAFETGNPSVDLTSVMVNLQKANLSFQTMVQVRNKLVSAYQEIMNMQV